MFSTSENVLPYNAFKAARNDQDANAVDDYLKQAEIFKLAMEHSAIGMALLKPEGQWVKVNQALCNALGYTESELLKIDFQKITHPDDLETDINYVHRLLSGEIQTCKIEKRYLRKDMSVVWAFLTVSLIRDESNRPLYFVAQIQDITEDKAIKEDLIKANDELESLSYHLSHDIRSPLRSSIGLSDIITASLEKGDVEKAQRLARVMGKSLGKLYGLADDILSLTQANLLDEPDQLLCVETLVNEAIDLLAHLENADQIEFRTDLRYTRPLNSKKTRIVMIMSNLISNAIKYSDLSRDVPFVKISTYEENGQFVLCVEDNGTGIEARFHSRIFGMFQRFHSSKITGSGIGLYMIKNCVEAIGGQISYHSLPTGSRFTVRL